MWGLCGVFVTLQPVLSVDRLSAVWGFSVGRGLRDAPGWGLQACTLIIFAGDGLLCQGDGPRNNGLRRMGLAGRLWQILAFSQA